MPEDVIGYPGNENENHSHLQQISVNENEIDSHLA